MPFVSFLDRDRLYRYIDTEGNFRVSFVETSQLVQEACKRHRPNPFGALLLGEALTAAALAASLLKEEDVISLIINNPKEGTPASHRRLIVAEAGKTGEVRGYLPKDPGIPNGKNRAEAMESYLRGAVLQTTKWRDRIPRDSYTEMRHGHIGPDLSEYYLQSEQILTEIRIDLHLQKDLSVQGAYGLLVQALPEMSSDASTRLKSALGKLPPIYKIAQSSSHSQEIVPKLLQDFSLKELDRYPVDFFCRCSRPGFLKSLAKLPSSDLKELANEGTQEVVCEYCNEHYYFTPDELRALTKKDPPTKKTGGQ